MGNQKKRLAVALPLSWSHVPSPFFLSFIQMLLKSAGNYLVSIYNTNTSLIDKMRELLAEEIKDLNPDYVLWIDADQLYPMETIDKLVAHVDAGHLVVGGVTPDKQTAKPMVYKFLNDVGSCARDRNFEVSRGLVKVDAMGFGGIMHAGSVLHELKPPFFPREWDEGMGSYVGEDFGFYNKCRKAGIDVWCDTDLHYSHMVAQAINVNRNPKCDSWAHLEWFGAKKKQIEEKVADS